MKVFDAHMHCFPDHLAHKAMTTMSKTAGVPYYVNGTVSETVQCMEQWHVDKGLFLHIATRPGQMHHVNDFAASIQGPKIVCFGSIHPYDENVSAEIDRIVSLGLHGLKFHFDYQGLLIDDPKMDDIYRQLTELNLPMTVHAGWDPYSPNLMHAPAERIAKIAERYPDLTIIAAHMGGMMQYKEVLNCLAGCPNVYFDTAMCSIYCPRDLFGQIVEKHGTSHIVFGSDCPWHTSLAEADYVRSFGYEERTLEDIFYNNLAGLLRLNS